MELYQTITERSMHLIKEGLKYILGVDFLILPQIIFQPHPMLVCTQTCKLHSFVSVSIVNFCVWHIKRLGRHKRTWQLEADSLNELIKTEEGMMDYADVLKDESLPNPADVATYHELKSILESAISKLSEKHREIYKAMLLETGVFSTENPYLSKFTTHYIQKWRDEVIQALKEALEE